MNSVVSTFCICSLFGCQYMHYPNLKTIAECKFDENGLENERHSDINWI